MHKSIHGSRFSISALIAAGAASLVLSGCSGSGNPAAVEDTSGSNMYRDEVPLLNAAPVVIDEPAMISVGGGTFVMGCTEEQGEDCWSDESPAHSVTVSSFDMGKYPVT